MAGPPSSRDMDSLTRTSSTSLPLEWEEMLRSGTPATGAAAAQIIQALRESEARYRVLAELSPDATLIAAQMRFAYANAAAARLLGTSSVDEIVGSECLRFIDPQFHDVARARMRRTLEEHSSGWRVESRWRRLDGTPVEVELSVAAVTWLGEPAIQVVVRDISERKRTERALRESEERYRLVALASDDVIWDWSLETNQVIWSPNLTRVLGYPVEEAGGTIEKALEWWSGHIHPDERERVVEDFTRAAAGAGETWREEYRFLRADGEYVSIVDVGYIGRNEAGVPTRFVGAMRDVTDLHRARALAEAASQAKSRFLSTLSHELRTPLNAVIGVADLLAGGMWGALTTPQAEQVARIKGSAWHLVSIIDEILTFTRAEAGKEEVRAAEVDLVAITAEVVELLQPEARTRALVLEMDPGGGPLYTVTDGGKVRQILMNLVGNALKYTDQGTVRVGLHATPSALEVIVADTGRGIPRERLEDIFEPFVQIDDSMTRTRGGTGLGLAICRRLARILGGDISVVSEPGAGSTFTLRLPARRHP